MRELAHRLFSNPPLFLCILIASTFANILALASPLFVIQVLNRFVAQGVSATLLTLTTGVLLAISISQLPVIIFYLKLKQIYLQECLTAFAAKSLRPLKK
jgi:ABC-type protease/lipase transport system fused ATPase/permease subunit